MGSQVKRHITYSKHVVNQLSYENSIPMKHLAIPDPDQGKGHRLGVNGLAIDRRNAIL